MLTFPVVGETASLEEIQARVAKRFDELFYEDQDGKLRPYVCCFCDEVLMCSQEISYLPVNEVMERKELFSWNHANAHIFRTVPTAIQDAYKFEDWEGKLDNSDWLNGLALSPRGHIHKKKNHHRSPLGFSSCNTCKTDIRGQRIPFYSIVNQNWVGNPPACLTDLTEVELAFITPVKGYGYVFKWCGGATRKLKGHLTFMRVEERTIATAVTQLEGMGLSHHVIVLVSGKMTASQVARATQKVRVDKVITAVEWLVENHCRWKGIDLNEFRRNLERFVPEVHEEYTLVESENQNVEDQKIFSCYYPDGTMTSGSGSLDDSEQFKAYVEKMKRNGYNLTLTTNMSKTFLDGKDGDQLISSCLLQFPYGVGGLKETRQKLDGSLTENAELEPFLAHLTKLSQKVFHHSFFQLVTFSLTSKLRLLRTSRLQLKGGRSVQALANGLTSQAVTATAQGRRSGNRYGGTVASRALLDAVDGISRALPHTDEAATKARSNGEAMQHHFGIPSLFLTITFDDENSLLMQVLADNPIDDDTPLEQLSDGQLAERACRRKELRMKFPGFAALSFEMLLQVAVEEVIGWDMRKNEPTESIGYFGRCIALTAAMEEQGRDTLHSHLCLWIQNFQVLRKNLFFGNIAEQREANKVIPKYFEHIASTALIGPTKIHTLRKAFDHECVDSKINDRPIPTVVDDQGLRNLRHRMGYKESSEFASCSLCQKCFTYERLTALYCKNVGKIVDLVTIDEACPLNDDNDTIPKSRMHAMCVAYQKKRNSKSSDVPLLAINGVYNAHASCHVKGCFRCQKKGDKNHKCGPLCECRFRMPDRSRAHAAIRRVKEGVLWFTWQGVPHMQPFIEILAKRSTYDLFQNVSCPAISETKFTCNSNISMITDGPVGQYQYKYNFKATQQEDSASYKHVELSIKCMEEKAMRVHDDDKKEAHRRLCRAAFAHNKENVIGAALASYLTRHDSRFYFSHKFQYCPLRDLKRALDKDTVSGTARFSSEGNVYFESMALHYLCRPMHLENYSAKDFFESYITVDYYRNDNDGGPNLRYITDTGFFKHPSCRKTGHAPNITYGPCVQGCKLREENVLIKVCQWEWPDTAKFKGKSILSCPENEINQSMETYAELMLLLFHPFRSSQDLQPLHGTYAFPYVMKIRELNANDHMLRHANREPLFLTDNNMSLLQNIQNSAYNSLRYKPGNDDLQSVTEPFDNGDMDTIDEETEEQVADEDPFSYEELLEFCDDDDEDDENPELLGESLQGYSFKPLRNLGRRGCGYGTFIPVVTRSQIDWRTPRQWIFRTHVPIPRAVPTSIIGRSQPRLGVARIVKLYLTKSNRSTRQSVFQYNPTAKVCDANGSLNSIRQWAFAAKLDPLQRRAFESIVSSFILTFFDFDELEYSDATVSAFHSRRARGAIRMLLWLKGGANNKDAQLILLLHGPGGSGKSTVIALVVEYAREYCTLLGHQFTIQTIVITAMSGVAATIIHGRTSHKAIGLNWKKPLDDPFKIAWEDTRLLLVDEVSFASGAMLTILEKNCRTLKKNNYKPYGGVNVVFSGDFSQLEPPRQTAIYNGDPCPAFTQLVNGYIELSGHHRYKEDPEWGEMLGRFRKGEPLLSDIEKINEHCMVGPNRPVPADTPVAVYRNANRDALNSAMFEEFCIDNAPAIEDAFCDEAAMVFMYDLEMHDDSRTYTRVTSNKVKAFFYTNCGEDHCKTDDMMSSRIDPVIKLYPGCPLMLSENSDVENGQANGSRVRLVKMNVNTVEQPMRVQLECGTVLPAYFASQIVSLTVRHEVQDITPQDFDVVSTDVSFVVTQVFHPGEKKRSVRMKGKQFPLISNAATTGHKLQGCGLSRLLVAEWHYKVNWPYVVLSRVRHMDGLYITIPLSTDLEVYKMPQPMLQMIRDFESRVGLTLFEEAEYDSYLTIEQGFQTPDATIVTPLRNI